MHGGSRYLKLGPRVGDQVLSLITAWLNHEPLVNLILLRCINGLPSILGSISPLNVGAIGPFPLSILLIDQPHWQLSNVNRVIRALLLSALVVSILTLVVALHLD